MREWIDVALWRDPGTDAVPPRAMEAGLNGLHYWFQLVQDLRKHPDDGLICDLFEAALETEGLSLPPATHADCPVMLFRAPATNPPKLVKV